MKNINIVYSKKYDVDIGPHVFPTVKYSLIKKKLIEHRIIPKENFVEPTSGTLSDILLVHTKEYVDKLLAGTLTADEVARLELPYSKELVDSSMVCVGGTLMASRLSLEEGLGIHLGGGFHHAFPDHGEGFCVFNDIAIAIKVLLKEKRITKALIVDCDLHQGNGTAYIFRGDPSVFTFSIHQENNYPFSKPKGSLDIGLADGADDGEYLKCLRKSIPEIIEAFKPDFIMYVAGADVYRGDRLGGLNLTITGIKERDSFIFSQAKNNRIPISVVLAGGYAEKVSDTVTIHYNTVTRGVEIICRPTS